MAEVICNELVDEHPRLKALGVRASSAGTFAAPGASMTPEAEQALQAIGLDVNHKHRSASFSREMAGEADLILAMQEQHMEELCALAPEAEDRIHTLRGYAQNVDGYTGGQDYDIEDPFRENPDVYIECAEQIQAAVRGVLDRLDKEWAGE